MNERDVETRHQPPAAAGGRGPEPELERRLGAWDATLLVIGSVIGTGIFITSADIARVLPDARLLMLVWIVGGLLSLAGALTYAELGVLFPDAGGMYSYLKEAYGPLPAFLFGWVSFLVIMSGGIAALAVAFGVYLGSFFGYFSPDNVLATVPLGGWTWTFSGAQLAAVLAILALTAINYVGVREGAWVQNLLTLIKVGAIVVFCVLGLVVSAPEAASATAASPVELPSGLLAAFGIGMIAALWTYDGWYGATFSAGELRRPQSQLPIGLIAGTTIIMLLYLGLNAVYLRALSLEEMAATSRIGETAAAVLFGPVGARALAAAVVISTLGCLSATILYSSRIYQPMARDGVFFRALARVHPRYRTPGRSLWAQSLWAAVLAASGNYEQIYTYVVFAAVLFHAATGGAVFVLRRKLPDAPRPYRVWGYPVVPLLFIGASVILVANTLWEKPVESLTGLGFLVLGLPAFYWWRRRNRAAGPSEDASREAS